MIYNLTDVPITLFGDGRVVTINPENKPVSGFSTLLVFGDFLGIKIYKDSYFVHPEVVAYMRTFASSREDPNILIVPKQMRLNEKLINEFEQCGIVITHTINGTFVGENFVYSGLLAL